MGTGRRPAGGWESANFIQYKERRDQRILARSSRMTVISEEYNWKEQQPDKIWIMNKKKTILIKL